MVLKSTRKKEGMKTLNGEKTEHIENEEEKKERTK